MQLNLYVPKEREDVVRALDRAAKRTGRAKNLMVLDALQIYLDDEARKSGPPKLHTYDIGVAQPWRRADIYEDILDGKYGRVDEARAAEEPAPFHS